MMYTTDANIVIKQIPYHDKTAHKCMIWMNKWMGSIFSEICGGALSEVSYWYKFTA